MSAWRVQLLTLVARAVASIAYWWVDLSIRLHGLARMARWDATRRRR